MTDKSEKPQEKFLIIHSDTVYKSEKIQIDRCQIKLPNGNTALWDVEILPDFFFGIPVKDECVLMTKEWRLGPNKNITQFTGSRCISDNLELNLNELKRELKEEIGIDGGSYNQIITFPNGIRTTGNRTYFVVSDFDLNTPNRDTNEIQETISLPINGLYKELSNNHDVTSDTLLLAKILEERIKP